MKTEALTGGQRSGPAVPHREQAHVLVLPPARSDRRRAVPVGARQPLSRLRPPSTPLSPGCGGRWARKPPRAAPRAHERRSRARRPARPESTARLGGTVAVWFAPRSLPTCRRDPRLGWPAPALISSAASTSEYDLVFLFYLLVWESEEGEKQLWFTAPFYFGKHVGPLIDAFTASEQLPPSPKTRHKPATLKRACSSM